MSSTATPAVISSSAKRTNNNSNAAISLLDKYATINSQIDSARKQTQQTTLNIQEIKQNMHTLTHVDRPQMKTQTQSAQDDIQDMKESQIPQLQSKMQNLQSEYQQLQDKQQQIASQIQRKRAFMKQRRLDFIRSCQHFRKIWFPKMIASSSQTCGENAKSNRSSTMMFSWMGSDASGVGNKNSLYLNDSSSSSSEEEEDDNGDYNHDASTSKHTNKRRKEMDFEIHQAKQASRTSLQNKSRAEIGLQDALKDLEQAKMRTKARRERLDLQRSQLDRVRKDVTQMEQEIQKVERDAKEARSIAEAYAKDACRRRRQKHAQNASNRAQITPNQSMHSNSTKTAHHIHINPYKTPSTTARSKTSSHLTSGAFSSSFHVDDDMTQVHQSSHVDNKNAAITPSPSASASASALNTANGTQGPSYHLSSITTQIVRANSPLDVLQSSGKTPLTIRRGNSSQTFLSASKHITSDEHRSYTGSSSPMNRQYPHRAGRIRVNRQFSTALEITSDESGRTRNNNNDCILKDDIEENDDDDDDDDDDEELLTYVAFNKKKNE